MGPAMEPMLPSVALAVSVALAGLTPAEVEKAYWDCEFTATQGIVSYDDAPLCSQLYEYLKENKFLGDFNQFLIWWRQHKDREISSRLKPRQPEDVPHQNKQ